MGIPFRGVVFGRDPRSLRAFLRRIFRAFDVAMQQQW
jgi:hypothetical protein